MSDEIKEESSVKSEEKGELSDLAESGIEGSASESAPAPVTASATTVPVVASPDTKLTIFDLAAGVLILAFLSLFAINCFIANLASSYNEQMCGVAIGLAGKAATDGKDTAEVRRSAYGFMDKCGPGGFFVERPELITFYDEIKPDLRQVTIATATKVLIPAPFICMDKSRFEKDGMHVIFKHVYQFKLNNPKNCNSGKVKINPTGKTFEIKMIDNPVINKPVINKPAPSMAAPKKKTGPDKGPKPVSNGGNGAG